MCCAVRARGRPLQRLPDACRRSPGHVTRRLVAVKRSLIINDQMRPDNHLGLPVRRYPVGKLDVAAGHRNHTERKANAELPIEPIDPNCAGEVARRWRYVDGRGEIGVIPSVSEPFCGTCSRLRLTADGMIKNCLLGNDEFNVKRVMRNGGSDEEIANLIRLAIRMKGEHHGLNKPGFDKLVRNMNRVGG